MLTILYTLLVLSGIFLIVMILLQTGKGAGAGLSIGGGMSQTMFGGSGGRSFFVKLTGAVAAVFMLICLILAKLATTSGQEYKGIMAGAEAPAAAAPAQPVQPLATVPAVQPVQAAPLAPAAAKK